MLATDFGDAPPSYPTLLESGGASHTIAPGFFLGWSVDGEENGQPDLLAQGDDLAGESDEDGVRLDGLPIVGSTTSLTIEASASGYVNAWIDLDRNGVWETTDQVLSNFVVHPGENNVPWTIPAETAPGIAYARFRFSSLGNLAPDGHAIDGEVEDYAIELLAPGNGAIYGQKFFDEDGDGRRDPQDIGVDGVRVDLFSKDSGLYVTQTVTHSIDLNADGVIDPATEQGLFQFTGLPAGEYRFYELWSETPFYPSGPSSYDVALGQDEAWGAWMAESALSCPPGDGWLGSCGAGQDSFMGTWSIGLDLPNPTTGEFDGSLDDRFYLFGTHTVARGEPTGTPTAVSTEIVAPALAGYSLKVGNLRVQAGDGTANLTSDSPQYSAGQIQEQPGDPSRADSLFAVFFSLQADCDGDPACGSGGLSLHNEQPLTVTAVVDRFAGAYQVYTKASEAVSLLDASGVERARIVSATLTPHYGGDLANAGELDFGDAPEPTYATLAAHNGARHVIAPHFKLGSLIDSEWDGQPSELADGDDINAWYSGEPAGDEDGVRQRSPLVPGLIATIEVSVTDEATLGGFLDAWIDLDRDGNFETTALEHIIVSQAVHNGLNRLSVLIPLEATVGPAFARFRLSSSGGLGPEGLALDGEVEDFVVTIEDSALDWGDAPDPAYPTLQASNGAGHVLRPGFYLGNSVDADVDGQPDRFALGDDAYGNDDDGIYFVGSLSPGQPVDVNVVLTDASGVGGVLDGWIDWNQNGDWSDPGEQVFLGQTLGVGLNSFQVSVPADAAIGYTAARFRLTRAGASGFVGVEANGEVEDYFVLIAGNMDFGDAPDLGYPTLSSSLGALHAIAGGLYLGAGVDADADGQPNPEAGGDDAFDGNDDEDGVVLPARLSQGKDVQIVVTASAAGTLNAWLDWNGNGDWSDPGDHFAVDQHLAAGPNTLTYLVPVDATPTDSTFARFRFSSLTGLDFRGAAPDGEVEDYQVAINAAPEATNLTQTHTYVVGRATVDLTDIVVIDPDAGEVITARLTLSLPSAGALSTGTFGTVTSVYDPDTGIWLAVGNVADVNAALAAVDFQPTPDGDVTTTIVIQVQDSLGAGPAEGAIALIVLPVTFSGAEAGGPYEVSEGATQSLDASGTMHPSLSGEALTYEWDFDLDGEYDDASGVQPVFSAALLGGPSSVTVGLRVSDSSGRTSTDTATIQITNVAPLVDAGPDVVVAAARTLVSSGSFLDPGMDPWTVTVNYGDGSGDQVLALDPETKQFQLQHVYTAYGTFPVTVTVEDGDGGRHSDTMQAQVDLRVTSVSVVLGKNQFTVFNASPRATVSVAYGTQPGTGTIKLKNQAPFTVGIKQPKTVNATADANGRAVVVIDSSKMGRGKTLYVQAFEQKPARKISDRVSFVIGPMPSLSIQNATADEDAGQMTFTVSLSAPRSLPVKVAYATADKTAKSGSDYGSKKSSLTIPAGQLSGTVTVPLKIDSQAESNEVFVVKLSSPQNAAVARSQATGTIVNDDFALQLDAAPGRRDTVGALTADHVAAVTDEAIRRWSVAAGERASAGLADVEWELADLSGNVLAVASGRKVRIDRDAAGRGWFVDPTPTMDEEFVAAVGRREWTAIAPAAVDRVDLLTVAMHELGHLLGLEDRSPHGDNLMGAFLGTGIRRGPSPGDVDTVLSAPGSAV